MIRSTIIALFLLLAPACGQATPPEAPHAPSSPPATAAAPAVPEAAPEPAALAAPATAEDVAVPAKNVLLFFLNPAGGPCKAQKAILEGMGSDLTDRVTVTYVSIQDNAGRGLFYTYGVRALPALVEVDPGGKELFRFTPGIREGADILASLR